MLMSEQGWGRANATDQIFLDMPAMDGGEMNVPIFVRYNSKITDI